VGHVVCSSCCAKLPDKCHCCSIATGYNRCHIIEHVVDSTKVPCCYDTFGCTEKIIYYEKENHEKVCPHAPCFCPETDCNFTGSTVMLLNHFSTEHKWHSARISYNKAFRMRIAQGLTALQGEDGQLFLVNMVLEPLGGLISVLCIQPHITGSTFKCKLSVSGPEMSYSQVTQFQTKSTKLFDGLPKDCFLFLVPKVLLRDSSTNVTAMVSVTIIPP
jgi:E3 ubiquitin-protein ligase SIAH1